MAAASARNLFRSLLGVDLFILLLVMALAVIVWMLPALGVKSRIPGEEEGNNRESPIVQLTDEAGFRFTTGSAELTDEFRQLLRKRLPEIERLAGSGPFNRIEVVGHTDEAVFRGGGSLLDEGVFEAVDLKSRPPTGRLAGDNVGLGMHRAAMVVRYLEELANQRCGRGSTCEYAWLRDFTIAPLSAGPVILPTGEVDRQLNTDLASRNDAARRRIEIRLLRLDYP